MSKYIYTFILIFTLYGCNVEPDLNKVNLKEYFYKISDYSTPKVLVVDSDSTGHTNRIYYLIKKIDDFSLSLTVFDEKFNKIEYIEDKYTTKGVELSKYTIIEDISNNITTDIQINDSYIFPFEDFNSKLFINSVFISKFDSLTEVSDVDEFQLIELIDKNINGTKVSTIVARGNLTRTIKDIETGQVDTYKIKMETWYSKGIGITMLKHTSPYGEYTDKFVGFITMEDFNNLKLNKQ